MMNIERHSLVKELPEYRDQIHTLKMNDNHFSRLFDEYHDMDHAIVRIEDGIENTSDDYLEELKKKRLNLKDQLWDMLKAA
jgi:uncharacterized protein YdcH (DUF465 family)